MRAMVRWVFVAVALILAFAAGVRLSGVFADRFSWCRDVDYGNVPQWLTVAAAFVTVFGVYTARQAYRNDVRTREVGQARLVHGELVRSTLVANTNLILPTGGEERAWVYTNGLPNLDDSKTILRVGEHEFAQLIWMTVYNNSDEIVTVLRLARHDTQTLRTDFHVNTRLPRPALVGGKERTWLAITDNDHPTSGNHEVEVIFQDSAGIVWRRLGSRPVAKFKPTGPEWDLTDPRMPLWAPWRLKAEGTS